MTPLLDTHQHLIYRDKISYSWTKDIPPLAINNFTIENYKQVTANLGIAGSLFMETGVDDSDYQSETKFINSFKGNESNNLIGLISSIRPENDKEFEIWLNETIQMNVVGYRRVLHVMPDETSKSNTFRKNIHKIGSLGKTFDICVLPSQLKIAKELAEECQNTSFILNHCGVPNIAADEFDHWRDGLKTLSESPNVICKLSGLMAYCAPGTSSYEKIEPYVDHTLNCFGTNRIVWGSDWPVVNLGKGLPEWISVSRKIFNKLSLDESTAIANGNAQKVYKINI